MRPKFFVLAALFLLGLSMLSGITGNVVSQTCCPGPECGQENQCAVLQQPSGEQSVIGSVIVLLVMALAAGEVILLRRKPVRKIDRVI